jgi:hypothetical protein
MQLHKNKLIKVFEEQAKINTSVKDKVAPVLN